MFRWLRLSGQQKDVTAIRGLDTELYNKIHARAKEMGKNVSELMNNAMKIYLDQLSGTPTVHYGAGSVDLKVSKDDLVKLGKVTFEGVVGLRFSEDVDEEAIENHVASIDGCVDVKVPKSAYVSVMKKARDCVNVQPYSSLATDAEARGITRIGGIDSLEISKEDLESLDRKIVLEDIDHLKLGPDIDRETVNRYIEVIKDVDELTVPKSIFMLILTKAKDCEEVSKY